MNQTYDVYGKLEDPTGVLSVNLAIWEVRDDSVAQPEVRTAANKAMDAIDEMLTSLYRIREQLIGETRQYDDATAVRVDAMLADLRQRREAGQL